MKHFEPVLFVLFASTRTFLVTESWFYFNKIKEIHYANLMFMLVNTVSDIWQVWDGLKMKGNIHFLFSFLNPWGPSVGIHWPMATKKPRPALHVRFVSTSVRSSECGAAEPRCRRTESRAADTSSATFSGLPPPREPAGDAPSGHEEQTRPTGEDRRSDPTRHVELRGDSAAAQRPADGRQRLLQLAHKTLPRGLPEDLRRQCVSHCWIDLMRAVNDFPTVRCCNDSEVQVRQHEQSPLIPIIWSWSFVNTISSNDHRLLHSVIVVLYGCYYYYTTRID